MKKPSGFSEGLVLGAGGWWVNGAGGSTDVTGIINHASVYKQTRISLGNFKLADAASMYGRMLPTSLNNAIWLIHPLNIPNLLQLADSSGRVVFLPNLQATGSPMLTLFGRPVVTCESLPAPSTGGGDVLFLDPKRYLCGINKELEVVGSPIYGMGVSFRQA